jgi:hypothetical protein
MSLLGAAGRPLVAIGGQHAYKNFRKGNISISLQWLLIGEKQEITACMCIYPANAMMMNVGAFAIPMQNAYLFADSKTGAPTPFLLEQAYEAVKHIGLFADRDTTFRMVDAIVESLPDLLAMPDIPDERQETELFSKPKLGIEVVATRNGQTMFEELA